MSASKYKQKIFQVLQTIALLSVEIDNTRLGNLIGNISHCTFLRHLVHQDRCDFLADRKTSCLSLSAHSLFQATCFDTLSLQLMTYKYLHSLSEFEVDIRRRHSW